jgi:predicted RNA-binding Zn-ribbon protein involved in translation (DUF1610 family)
MNSVIVATDCPSCGAPLDFDEGSNAITCGHCGSNLLVTGRKQLLSYSVSPKLDESRAVALAVMAQRNMGRGDFRGINAKLYFIPYYRMTGQDFSWEKPAPKPAPEEEYSGEIRQGIFGLPATGRNGPSTLGGWISILDTAGELMGTLFGKTFGSHRETEDVPCFAIPEKGAGQDKQHGGEKNVDSDESRRRTTGGSLYEKGEVILNDRYIEKNFLACDLDGTGLYSLGVRPAVLRLELFRPDALKTVGKIVHPAMGPDAAESLGMKTASDKRLLYRKVIGKILSLVYFPFWFVEMESRGAPLVTVIDAVSEAVIKADAQVSVYETLDREFRDTPKVIGFRPLTCPNCGWDFPVRKDNTIFFCKTCGRAWQICGSELCEVQYQVAEAVQPGETVDVQYLPFWVLHPGQKSADNFRFFMPAFRYRRLKFLLDLGLKISRLQPSYKVSETKNLDLFGCYYDTEDAALLAQFVQAILDTHGFGAFGTDSDDALPVSGSTLTWVPFLIKGAYLCSPFGQISIPQNLLSQ